MFLLMLAAALPGLFWEQGSETADALKKSGIECIQVAPPKAEAWKRVGFCATAADLSSYQKLAQPGVEYRPDVASATRATSLASSPPSGGRTGRPPAGAAASRSITGRTCA